ncbi:MAG TPA: hypothetical protein GXZ66_04260 [Clostridiaceae bacterium]|jgi:hypothetical protein|nr:hypothetical protein [Clostridiaceae bacterium]
MFARKVKIKVTPSTLQPTIFVLKMTEDEFNELNEWKQEDCDLYLVDESTKKELHCQISDASLEATPDGNLRDYCMYILVNNLESEEDTTYTFSINKRKKEEVVLPNGHSYNPWGKTKGVFLENQLDNKRVIVCINGALFTRYLYSEDLPKPYFYPLIGPAGKTLIHDQADDHLHHHGLWWGHDSVNGHQLYHEFRGEGRQRHVSFLSCFSGPVFGQITALIDWQANNGERLLRETRTMRIYNMPNDSRYVDLVCQLHATEGDVEFSDTKEGGFPFVRVNEEINGHHTGQILSSNNDVGESNVFGKEADWVDYTGKIKRGSNYVTTGLSVFVHPTSDDYPAKWFVRDYGPFTSSNFHFCGGHTIKRGDKYTFKQRLYIHKNSPEEAFVNRRYEEYKEVLKAVLT